jgi:ribosomal protein L37AE/L43A
MRTKEIFSINHVKNSHFGASWICPECSYAYAIGGQPTNCPHCGFIFDEDTWRNASVQITTVTKTIHREAIQSEAPDAGPTV